MGTMLLLLPCLCKKTMSQSVSSDTSFATGAVASSRCASVWVCVCVRVSSKAMTSVATGIAAK